MKAYCSECRKPCEVTIDDCSFDHEFGCQVELYAVSACCEAEVYHDPELKYQVKVAYS
jgi:hypothetical protein